MANKEYTEEELNYFRVCYITTHIIREGLKELFKREWDRHYSPRFGLWQDTARNGQDFFRMESKKSRSKNSRLLCIIQNGNTEEWDCTCFFFAILYSDTLGSVISPTIAKDVDDLRMFRNEVFAHRSKACFPEAEFQRCVSKVSNAFASLHLITVELQRISNQRSFPTEERQKLQEQVTVLEDEIQGKPKSFEILPQEPSHAVVERKVEVENILQKFTDLEKINEGDSIVTIYISGNPGCGKSQVARQVGRQFFAREAAKNDHDSCALVMTLNAESEQSVLDSYYTFARKVGVTEYSLNSIAGGDSVLLPYEKISHLKTLVSSKMENYCSWLLVYDNVNKLSSIRDYLPNEHWGGCGHVLVTTQDGINIPEADPLCASVSLSKGMQSEDARILLRKICGFSSDREDESLVLNASDYQPLAIACAAVYIQFIGVSQRTSSSDAWKKYLKKLETLEKRALTERAYEQTNGSYQSSMTAAVTLALEKLVQEPTFEHVIPFLALGASTPVNVDLIVHYLAKQDPDCDEDFATSEIVKCALLLLHSPDDSLDIHVQVKMHQVVREVFKRYLLDKYSKEQIAGFILLYIETLSTSVQHDPFHFDLNFHMTSKMMAPHVKSLSDWLTGRWNLVLANTGEKGALQRTLFNFGDICRKHAFLFEAKDYFNYALQIAKDDYDCEDHNKISFISTILNNLGLIFQEADKFEMAELYYTRSLETLRALHPPDTSLPEIADSLNKLGTLFFICSLREIEYGLQPSELGTRYCNDNSSMEKAKDFFQQSLDMRKQLYGLEHPEVASSLSNVGSIHSVMGDLETAKDSFQRSHALRKKIYGEKHPCVADSLNNIGILYSEMDLTLEAVQYHEKSLEMRKELFFHDHTVIADSYNNLALAYQHNGQLEQAEECFEEALRIREKISGKEHTSVAVVLFNFSELCLQLGEVKEGEDLRDRAQQILFPFNFKQHRLLCSGFIPNGELSEHFKSCMKMHGRYFYGVAESGDHTVLDDPLPPERFPIKCKVLTSTFSDWIAYLRCQLL